MPAGCRPIVIKGGGITITNSDPDVKPATELPESTGTAAGSLGRGPTAAVPNEATSGQGNTEVQSALDRLGDDSPSVATGAHANCPSPVPTVGPGGGPQRVPRLMRNSCALPIRRLAFPNSPAWNVCENVHVWVSVCELWRCV